MDHRPTRRRIAVTMPIACGDMPIAAADAGRQASAPAIAWRSPA
jgi:hypothetical protein